ncbi:unnamed protein product [Rotaria magnacalcarata]|uniref:Uncharacterized protein n=3 Tax=Rotaria magnacalcarata TaxID=392030 RepID=A0A816ZIB0_9BILA|nr:unnamed protein product [Rotaria magnacalcarata]
MDEQYVFSTSSALFDTYLIYGIIGLLLFTAIIGLIILLATSCCCCCLCPKSCCLCYHHHRRHSSYKLRKRSKDLEGSINGDSKKNAFIRRHPSDVADFSQLYDSCPHLINSKVMTTSTHMDTSCTTIDTLISPISPCSSFHSFIGQATSTNNTKPTVKQNDPSNSTQKYTISTEKTNNASASSTRGPCSRPFSYIKNTNDRAQILRRFTSNERTVQATTVSIDLTRISSSESDSTNPINSNCTNIYETVLPTTHHNSNSSSSSSDISTPIYETEWTHSLRQLMLTTASSTKNDGISIIKLPTPPPDLVPSIEQASDYFQQQDPHDKFLESRSRISDSMRRTTMLTQLKDNSAFLY